MAEAINLPDSIRDEMAMAPVDADESEEEDEEEDLQTTDIALPALGVPAVDEPPPAKISAKSGSLKKGPPIRLDKAPTESTDQGEEPGIDDESEPDVLAVPVVPLRKLMMRYLYAPILAQQMGVKVRT